MNENNHLPVYGIGPYLIGSITLITVLLFLLSQYDMIPVFRIEQLNLIFIVLGILLVIIGVIFWLSAIFKSRITQNIEVNQLVTTGIYGIVRHPIYSAFLFAISGFIMIYANIVLFFMPIIYWIILTVTMIKTEEKWLTELYGNDYLDYSKKVNRFIPKVI